MKTLLQIVEDNGLWDVKALKEYAAQNQVKVVLHDDLALLNYQDSISRYMWNDFNRQSRGSVLDLAARRLVDEIIPQSALRDWAGGMLSA